MKPEPYVKANACCKRVPFADANYNTCYIELTKRVVGLFASCQPITLDQDKAGRLAATLLHFHNTGELPRLERK